MPVVHIILEHHVVFIFFCLSQAHCTTSGLYKVPVMIQQSLSSKAFVWQELATLQPGKCRINSFHFSDL